MSTSYLLDTSMLVLLLKQDTKISKKLAEVGEATFYVSTIALGELYYGAEHSINIEKSRADVDTLTRTMTILTADNATARKYGLLKHEQRARGWMLPDNDLWIAATAFQYGLTLIARDHHFTWIADLILEQW
jgi:tRNA(fMet)-specific endonuclease VapC